MHIAYHSQQQHTALHCTACMRKHTHCCCACPLQEGGQPVKRGYKCRNLTLPQPNEPVLFKSHVPFFPSFDRASVMPGAACAVLLLVRNPVDAHNAWSRCACC
jgi:hypothetical protein